MRFKYTGPFSGVTLADGQEILLHPGAEVELPEGHEYVKTLAALGHLTPLAPARKTTEDAAKPAKKGN